MVVIIKKILFLFFLNILISTKIYGSIILDYETEEFLKKINNLIISVNDFGNDIKFKIILDENINAFVNQNNEIFISSGLIKNAPSYVALLGVLSHEIGHIEKYHITKRKKSLKNLQSIQALSTLSIIAGSIVSENPEVIQGLAVNQFGIHNYYIGFSKDQEREADHYTIETLNKLNLPPDSLIKLLKILQTEQLKHGSTEDYKKFSTHPVYKERYDIINERKNIKKSNINMELEKEFNFIKAKFIGYSSDDDIEFKKLLPKEFINYSKAILYARKGDLKKSLKLLNNFINDNKENYFLYETKADILMSYGYNKQAIKFYEKTLTKFPKNKYAQLAIFNNTNIDNFSIEEKIQSFEDNLDLLFQFPYSEILYLNFYNLSVDIKKTNWSNFLNLYKNKKNINEEEYNKQINNLIRIDNDKKLNKLLKLHLKI